MRSSKETKIWNTICTLLVLLAGVVRLLAQRNRQFSYNGFIFMLFTLAISIWIYQLRRRLLQPHVRRNLMGIAAMMLFWMALRTVKYEFLPNGHFTVRYAWYLFYVPLVLIPLWMFLSVLYIGRPHERAFYFPNGLAQWSNSDYTYGFVYYGVVVWMAALFIAIMAIVFVRCAVPDNRKKIWIPMIPFSVGIIYTLLYVLKIDNILIKMLNLPEIG